MMPVHCRDLEFATRRGSDGLGDLYGVGTVDVQPEDCEVRAAYRGLSRAPLPGTPRDLGVNSTTPYSLVLPTW